MISHVSLWGKLLNTIGDSWLKPVTWVDMFTFDDNVFPPYQWLLMYTVIYHKFFTLQILYSCDSILL